MEPGPRRERLHLVLAAGALVLGVALAWSNSLGGAFTYDDKVEVVGNRTLRTLTDWSAVVGYNAARPLVVLTWALDWRLWGLDPRGYHAVNLFVHAANAVLVLLVGQEVATLTGLRRPLSVALLAAALWALHPMTTEAVTYVTGRSEALCATFYLGAVLGWLRWRRGGDWVSLLVAFLSFLAATASKEVAATLPAMLLLLESTLPGLPRTPRRTALGLAPFWAVLVVGLVARKALFGVFTTAVWPRPVEVQIATELEVVVRYLGLWLLPLRQSVFHDHPAATGLLHPGPLLSLALLGLPVGIAVAQRRARPWLLLTCGWWGLLLLPSSSFIPLRETMAEHRAYLAGWALCLAVALCAAPLLVRRPRATLALAAAGILALGAATFHRNLVWRTEVALWGDATEKNPGSAEAWYGYGDALRFAGAYDPAIDAYRQATRLDDLFLDAWNNLGIALAEQGRQEEARAIWLETLRRHPSYCKAHNNLGWLASRREDWDEAMVEFRTALTYCPTSAQAHFGLGNIHYRPRRDPKRALYHYQATLEFDPTFPDRTLVERRIAELTF